MEHAHIIHKCSPSREPELSDCHEALAMQATVASVLCLVRGKAEPAIRPSKAILYKSLNGKTTMYYSSGVFATYPECMCTAQHRKCIHTHSQTLMNGLG